MRKKIRKVKYILHKTLFSAITFILAISIMGVGCSAEEGTADTVKGEVDGIIGDFYSIIPDGEEAPGGVDDVTESVSIKRIFSGIIETLKGSGGELSSFLLTILGIALFASLSSVAEGELAAFCSRSVLAICSVMLFEKLFFLMDGAAKSLGEINSFFNAVIPVTVAVNSVGVSPTTATTQAVGMGITLGIYSFVSSEIMTKVVFAVFLSSAASGIDPLFGRVARGVRNILVTSLGLLTALVGATFSLQSVISASADSAIVRGARYAISSSVPIVGGAVSGALGIAIGGVSYARSVVGGGGIAVILSLMLSPLILLFAYRLCLKAGAFFVSVSSAQECEGVLNAFIGSLDCLIAVYVLSSVIYIVELAAFLLGGGLVA
jgi:stage III sporulation protein AE